MKTLCILLAMAGISVAGEAVVTTEVSTYTYSRPIPQYVLQGIKDRAVLFYPGQPKSQEQVITDGIEAYFELATVPDNPIKSQAAVDYPFDFPKQLYLARRGT